MLKPQEHRQGAEQKAAKLTDDHVRQMRTERKAGATIKELADKYRVGQSTVSQICNRLTWTHVE